MFYFNQCSACPSWIVKPRPAQQEGALSDGDVCLSLLSVCLSVCLSVSLCLSPTSTLNLHSAEGAAVSHDACRLDHWAIHLSVIATLLDHFVYRIVGEFLADIVFHRRLFSSALFGCLPILLYTTAWISTHLCWALLLCNADWAALLVRPVFLGWVEKLL